mgnify:CR=1 FL=1
MNNQKEKDEQQHEKERKEQDFDIILILGTYEKLFKRYVDKIHPDIIQSKQLQMMLEYQIKDFNDNDRYLSWTDLYEKTFPNYEEPEIFRQLDKKNDEYIEKQSAELL